MARVLVIAEARIARRLVWVLEGGGHTLSSANDLATGLVEASASHPEVAVVNGVVPPEQLEEYTHQLEVASPGILIVDVSRQAGEDVPRLADGADGELTQPFHADELLDEVDRVLGRTRLPRPAPSTNGSTSNDRP